MKLIYSDKHSIFIFKCPFSKNSIPRDIGLYWKREGNFWYTKDIMKARLLRKYAGKELNKRFDKYMAKVKKTVSGSYKYTSDIKIPLPDHCPFNFYEYQKAGVEFIHKRKYSLIADDMGLGKTPSIIGAINLMPDFNKIIIICPNSVKYNWKKEWETWSIHTNKKVCVYNSSNIKDEGDVIIINYEVLNSSTNPKSKKFRNPKKGKYNSSLNMLNMVKGWKGYDYLVCDESHRLKNLQANTTRNVMKIAKLAKKITFATGTPILSQPEDIWTTIKMFGFNKKFENNKQKFMKKYCGAYFDRRWKRTVTDIDSVRPEILEELQIRLRKNFMIRRLKSEVLTELPEKIRSIVPLEIPQKYIREFSDADISKDDLSLLSTNSDGQKSILRGLKPNAISELTELRKVTGEAKVKPVTDFVKELLEQGKKVVLYAHHTDVIEAYIKKFKKYGVVSIYGKTPDNEREDAKQKFQNDPDTRVFIGNFRAASEGITLTASHTMVMAEFDWVPAIMMQTEDRIYRISQDVPCDIYYMCADQTMDSYILSAIIKKIKIIEQIIEKESSSNI